MHTKESIFITKAIKKHKGVWGYHKVNYINSRTKVIFVCRIHGDFEQYPNNHLQGTGCSKCGYLKSANKHRTTNKSFTDRADKKHKGMYTYNKTKFIRSHLPVIVTCSVHGDFNIEPSNHLAGQGCPKCGQVKANMKNTKTLAKFIQESIKIHGNKYNYHKTKYTGVFSNIIITCPVHGDFKQIANNHTRGNGCPTCKSSKGELAVIKYLVKQDIKYITEYKLNNTDFRYDFYLPELNILIEYDGVGHYKPIAHWGGKNHLSKVKENDKLKNTLADMCNIPLIRIPYTKYDTLGTFLNNKIILFRKREACLKQVL